MFAALSLLVPLLSPGALAQSPPPAAPAPVSLELNAPVADPSRQREALEDVTLLRWADSKETSVDLKKGDAVEIVATGDNGLVRVRKGTDFGWIDASKLGPVTSTPPAPTP